MILQSRYFYVNHENDSRTFLFYHAIAYLTITGSKRRIMCFCPIPIQIGIKTIITYAEIIVRSKSYCMITAQLRSAAKSNATLNADLDPVLDRCH